MKTSSDKTILLLLAMGLTLLSAHIDVAYDVIPHSDVDVCDLLPADTCDSADCCDEPGHGNDNCCQTGCQHCSLPCCYGSAMIPTLAQLMDAAPTSDGRLAATSTDVTWVDPDRLFHPPQA